MSDSVAMERVREIEALAGDLVALVNEFEEHVRQGLVPRDFAERLERLRAAATSLLCN